MSNSRETSDSKDEAEGARNYNQMVSSAEKIKIFAEEMVDGSPLDWKRLNHLGANLSAEYDRLSHASVEAVQRNMYSEASKALRLSVVQLGQRCLHTIKELGDIQSQRADDSPMKSILENETSMIEVEADRVLNALHLLQDARPYKNVYWKCIVSLEDILDAYRDSSSKEALDAESFSTPTHVLLDFIVSKSQTLCNVIKMVIANLLSPDDEKEESLNELIREFVTLQKLITNFPSNSESSPAKDLLMKSGESLMSLVIDLLITCNEAEGTITSRHTKEILKASVKDTLVNLKEIADISATEKKRLTTL